MDNSQGARRIKLYYWVIIFTLMAAFSYILGTYSSVSKNILAAQKQTIFLSAKAETGILNTNMRLLKIQSSAVQQNFENYLQGKDAQLQAAQEQLRALHQELDKSKAQIENLRKGYTVRKLKGKLGKSSKTLNNAILENLRLKSSLKSDSEKLNEAIKSVKNIERINTVLSGEIDELTGLLNGKDKLLQEAVSKLEEKNRQEASLLKEAQDAKNESEALKAGVSAKQEELAKTKQELEALKETAQRLEIERESFFNELNNIKKEFLAANQEKENLNAQINRLNEALLNAQAQLNDMRSLNVSIQDKMKEIADTLEPEDVQAEEADKKVAVTLVDAEPQTGGQNLQAADEPVTHYNQGVEYSLDGRFKEAAREFKRAIQINPKDADAYYNLAVIYDEQFNNKKQAAVYYKKYLELKPDAQDAKNVKAWLKELQEK